MQMFVSFPALWTLGCLNNQTLTNYACIVYNKLKSINQYQKILCSYLMELLALLEELDDIQSIRFGPVAKLIISMAKYTIACWWAISTCNHCK